MCDWWQGRPWRLIQTNLREIDMRDIDAAQVAADLKTFKANVLMLNAAGIIASYPTSLPFHFQSPYLQGDSLQTIIAMCHEASIHVVARTDFSKVRRPLYEAHPEWAYVSSQGEIVEYNGDVHVCINGEYQQTYALKIIEELFETCDFDGIFFNMGGYQTRDYSGTYYGPCHCENCQRAFGEMFGLPLPEVEDLDDPVFRKYTVFKRRTRRAHQEKVYRFISERWPTVCIANHLEFGRGFIRQESNTALGRPLPHWQYSASDNTKWAVTNYPAMMSSNTTVDFIDYPYRHVAVSPHQQALRLAQSLANGGALDYYLIGRLDNHEDRSGFEGIRDIFHYHAAHEAVYSDLCSKAEIALLDGPYADREEFRGWFRFLTENHFLFDTVRVDVALSLPWEKYRAVIVPNLEALEDALAERLDAFVAAGGTLVAVYRSGFRDGVYEARKTPVLRSLGLEAVLRERASMRASYFKFETKADFPRFADTDLVYMDGPYLYAQYAEGAEPRLKLIPPHNFGPPERCYYTLTTDHPGFVVHPYGQGRAVYLPWLPGRLFYRQGHTNTWDFCADLLAGVAELTPIGGNVPPQVEVTLFEKPDGGCQVFHLVNGSGHFGTSFFAPVVMTDLEVRIPCAREPSTVESLRERQACAYQWENGCLTITIPRLQLFEALKIS